MAALLPRVSHACLLASITVPLMAITGCGANQAPSYTENLQRLNPPGSEDASKRTDKEGLNPQDLENAIAAKAEEQSPDGSTTSGVGTNPDGSNPASGTTGSTGSIGSTNTTGSNGTTGSTGGTGTTGSTGSTGSTGGTGGPTGTEGNPTWPTGTGGTGTTGVPPTYVSFTQNLTQPAKKPVDILFIVDTSGSMSEEQTYLATNFDSFINKMKSTGVQFQTALTSTDICDPYGALTPECPVAYGGNFETRLQGRFVGTTGRTVLKDSDADLVTKFNSYAKMGVNGSGFEHGLRAAHLAVEKSLSGANQALIRSNAFLSIIVVSDEEDDGLGLSQTDSATGKNFHREGLTNYKYTHNDFINYVNGVKGKGNFAVTAITGTRDQAGKICTSAHSRPPEEGTQYINAANATGGKVQSICEVNWSQSLGEIGQDLTAQISQISLQKVPYVPSIVVKVNGAAVTTWEYVSGSNGIKFGATSTPPPGAQISVTYLAAP